MQNDDEIGTSLSVSVQDRQGFEKSKVKKKLANNLFWTKYPSFGRAMLPSFCLFICRGIGSSMSASLSHSLFFPCFVVLGWQVF